MLLQDNRRNKQGSPGFHIEGGGGWDFPSPQKFEKYDVIIASKATIGSIIL